MKKVTINSIITFYLNIRKQERGNRYVINNRVGLYHKQKLLLEADQIALLGQDDLKDLEAYLNKELGLHSKDYKKLETEGQKNQLRNKLRKSKFDLIAHLKANLEAILFLLENYKKNNSSDGALAKIFPSYNLDDIRTKKWDVKIRDEFRNSIFSDSEKFRREFFSEDYVSRILNCIFDMDRDVLDINDKMYRLKIANMTLNRSINVILEYVDPKYRSFVERDFDNISSLSSMLAASYPN